MRAHSKEFRRDVLVVCDAGLETLEVANQFRVSTSWVRRIKQERRESGKVAPATTRQRGHVWDRWSDWLLKQINDRPDIYLRELRVALQHERGVNVSLWTLSRACRTLQQSREKDADCGRTRT